MRNEKEVIQTVLDVADNDEAVRAVIRTDFLPKRKYEYYNFCFVVNDTEKYDRNVFEKCFGERILLYRGDKNYPDLFPNNTKAHLMVFSDAITIAITVMDREAFLARYNGEKGHENVWIGDTYQKILDKDGMLPEIERLDEKQTWYAGKPSEEEFIGTCNEFWWVMKTFAEYTLRKELPSAMFYLNVSVRDLLNRMIKWYLFLQAGQPIDMGILDSNMEKLMSEELFLLYKQTYPTAEYVRIWDAFDAVVKLWNVTGNAVAGHCGYDYSADTEKQMLSLIKDLREDQN
ncbi:MAG: aminoglycoside 6-adenylyltransferase [Lachnospiraceae bacterium]|nr:aminoglycoside 6-adenylyltransferase [Lachnospiraceae bacterium]